MKVDFGVVKNYVTDRGFGFVSRTFLTGHQPEVFFHIKTLKKSDPDLAEKLIEIGCVGEMYFWYEIKDTAKGEQVNSTLDSTGISEMSIDNLPEIIEKVEGIWRNTCSEIPGWLRNVTFDLLGASRCYELISDRNEMEIERVKIEVQQREEIEAQKKIEEEKIQKKNHEQKLQLDIERDEFVSLVAELMPLCFTNSGQVSKYIVNNRLGYKYPNISGIVKMEQEGTVWEFKGGFPSRIYAKLCEELDLSDNGSRARAVGFESFKDMKNKR